MNKYQLFDKNSTVLFYNLKANAIQSMLDFDFISQRTPSIAAIIHPGRTGLHKAFFGQQEILIPIYKSITEAAQQHPRATGMINFASFRSAYESSREALGISNIRTVVIVAEGMPEQQTKKLIAAAQQHKTIIGPATVGGIIGGALRLGYAGGELKNIIHQKLYRPGSVGLVSKSGGMLNEMCSIIAQTTNGISEAIAIGGDKFSGSTLLDHIIRFEQNPEIKLIVALGELGGHDEYDIAAAKREGKITKPLICWTAGTSAKIFAWEVQFGHAGAKAGTEEESAQAKNNALRNAGIIVPSSFNELPSCIHEQFIKLTAEGKISPREEQIPPQLPLDFSKATAEQKVRRETTITSTISSDLGEEPTYGNVPVSALIEQKSGIGEIISILWFKKKLPKSICQFFELILILCADHGPAVSGAHNAIVTARAGKDIISALCSGLLTIGPRFGGAIDDACRYFQQGHDHGIGPEQLVEDLKQKGIPFPGIGHRVKSIHNPDKRVAILAEYARKNFRSTPYLDYALTIETVTLQKGDNLILNVDGCIAAVFLDALADSKQFSAAEINEIVALGYMNGLFALARSIGLIGHILDQKRLGAGLYRHPADDIFYGE